MDSNKIRRLFGDEEKLRIGKIFGSSGGCPIGWLQQDREKKTCADFDVDAVLGSVAAAKGHSGARGERALVLARR